MRTALVALFCGGIIWLLSVLSGLPQEKFEMHLTTVFVMMLMLKLYTSDRSDRSDKQ